MTHNLGENAHKSSSEDTGDPISEDEDPFTDPVSLVNYRLKPPPTSPLSLPRKEVNKGDSGESTAHSQHHDDEGDKPKRAILTNKSTNHPILTQFMTVGEVAHKSVAAITFPQPHKRETLSSLKIHSKKKPRFGPQGTPQPIIEVELPTRPRKSRQTGLSLEDQDFPTILSPSKARRPDCRSHFRRYSGISEGGSGRPYYEPPTLLGISDVGMNDSIGAISGTWVRERAKNIFGGTKKTTERILGISPSSARYKHRKRRGETSKLEDKVIQKRREAEGTQERRTTEYPAPRAVSTSEIQSSGGGVVDLCGCLEDPFSSSEGYEPDHNMNAKVNEGNSVKSGRGGLRRLEGIRDLLVLGSTKIQHKYAEEAVVTKQPDTEFCIKKYGSPASSFLVTADLSPGAAYEFNHSESDNRMLSSSPIAKSTPKKEWYRYEDRDTANTFGWKTNCRTKGKPSNPVKAMIVALDSSDTDCLEGISMRELRSDNVGDRGGENNWDERDKEVNFFNGNKIRGNPRGHQKQNEVAIRFGRTKNPLVSNTVLGNGRYKEPYEVETLKSDIVGDYFPLNMSVDGGSESEEDKRAIARANIIYSKEEEENPRKRCKYVTRTDGSRLSPRDKKPKLTDRVEGAAAGFGDGKGNRAIVSRTVSKSVVKESTGRKGRKGRKGQKSFLAYDRMETEDIDELQMDLPGMRI